MSTNQEVEIYPSNTYNSSTLGLTSLIPNSYHISSVIQQCPLAQPTTSHNSPQKPNHDKTLSSFTDTDSTGDAELPNCEDSKLEWNKITSQEGSIS